MSATSYPVTSATPVFLSWGANALTVVNQSTSAPVYLNDTSGLGVYRLGPAQAIRWDGGKPLYASVDAGSTVTVALSTDAGTLFSPVAVVGS